MFGENQDAASQETTVDPTQNQPQVDPAASLETPEQDNRQETTGGVNQRELLHQTRHEQLRARLREVGIDPDAIMSGDVPAGSIFASFQNQQTPAQQPAPQPAEAHEFPQDFDPYDPAQMKAYLDQNFGKIRGNLSEVVRGVIKEVRQQEQYQAQAQQEMEGFNNWASENHVPQQVIDRAVQQYYTEFGYAGTPKAVLKVVKQNIRDMGFAVAQKTTETSAIQTAINKAKALDAVAQPAPGAAPSPNSQQKTWAEQHRDDIAPPDPEPVYN